jgi:hypothetical protein
MSRTLVGWPREERYSSEESEEGSSASASKYSERAVEDSEERRVGVGGPGLGEGAREGVLPSRSGRERLVREGSTGLEIMVMYEGGGVEGGSNWSSIVRVVARALGKYIE